MADDFVRATDTVHPFPWGHIVYPNGRIVVVDAEGKEVQILNMVEFLDHITTAIANRKG